MFFADGLAYANNGPRHLLEFADGQAVPMAILG
jgi:hypothetical protein